MFRWRKMTWVLLVWVALIIAWVVAGANSGNDCADEPAHLREACEFGTEVGTGIGLAIVVVIGFMGFIMLSLIWFMTRPKQVVYVPAAASEPTSDVQVNRPAPARTKPAGWYQDPGGRYDYRYYDQGWTDDVANDGDDNTYIDPVPRR